MRLTEECQRAALRRRPTSGSPARATEGELRDARWRTSPRLYDEHGVLLRAIVEVVDLRRGGRRLLARDARALRRRHASGASRRSRRPDARRRRRARRRPSRLSWMTERTCYQQSSRRDPTDRRARRRPDRGSGCAASTTAIATTRRPRARADRVELAGLELALDVAVDLVLGDVSGLSRRSATLAQAAELQDLEHVDEVDAGRQHEQAEQRHHSVQPRAGGRRRRCRGRSAAPAPVPATRASTRTGTAPSAAGRSRSAPCGGGSARVGPVDRPPVLQPLEHDEAGVEERHGEDHQRERRARPRRCVLTRALRPRCSPASGRAGSSRSRP